MDFYDGGLYGLAQGRAHKRDSLSSGERTFSRELRNISLRGCGAARWQSLELILKVVSRHCIATGDGRHVDEGQGRSKHRLHSFSGGNF